MKYKGLTYEQHKFVEMLLDEKNKLRQGECYRIAYSIEDTEEGRATANTNASKLLKNTKIMAHIDKVLTRRHKNVNLTAERVLAEIMNIAFADVRQFFDEDGNFKDIHELTIDQQAAIEKIESQQIFEYDKGHKEHVGDLKKLVFHSKAKALEMLCKNLKLLGDSQGDKKDVNVTVNVTPQRTFVFQDIDYDGDEQSTEATRLHATQGATSNRLN